MGVGKNPKKYKTKSLLIRTRNLVGQTIKNFFKKEKEMKNSSLY